MSAVEDQLVLSEERATAAVEALTDLRGTEAMVSAALSQRDAVHALALSGQSIADALNRIAGGVKPVVSVSKLAGAIRDGYRAAPSPVDFEEYIAKFVLNTLGIEATV